MLHYIRILLIILFLPIVASVAQQKGVELTTTPNNNLICKDSLCIRDYSELVMIGVYISAPYMNMNISPVGDSIGKYTSNYKGNYSSTFGFTLGYKVLGISYGFKLPLETESIDSLGKSSFSSLGIKIRNKSIILSFDKRKYEGFYDANTQNYNTSIALTTPFIIRPDLAVKSYAGSGIWNPHWKKYSYSAPYTYCDRQVRTKIGFLLKADFRFLQLASDSSLISSDQKASFSEFGNVKSVEAYVFKTGPGMGMNIVFFKRMYFAMNVFLMNNSLLYRYNNTTGTKSDWQSDNNYFLEGGAGFGYSSEHYYIGLSVNGENNIVKLNGASIQTSFGTVSLDTGFRIKPPKALKKGWEKTMTKYLGL